MALVAQSFPGPTWHPSGSRQDYALAGTARRTNDAPALPNGFLKNLTMNNSWDGSQLDPDITNVYHLTDHDILEIDLALAVFKSK
jgi:hypothetical protein